MSEKLPSSLLALSQIVSLLFCQVRAATLAFFEALRLYVLPLGVRAPPDTTGCTFYAGTVRHVRLRPASHSFSYAVRYCLVDLEEPSPSPYVQHQLSSGERMTAAEARALSGVNGKIRVLLLPASAGYEQNPIVVYYCYDEASTLQCCIAEVTNTPWGDRVAFPFTPSGDLLPKPLHVSPLQDMRASWRLQATVPGDKLHVTVACRHPELGHFFVATLDATIAQSVSDPERWAFLMPHSVAWWIYRHAVVLMLQKGVPFLTHPKGEVGSAGYQEKIRRLNSDCGWAACPAFWRDTNSTGEPPTRPILWKDATAHPWE